MENKKNTSTTNNTKENQRKENATITYGYDRRQRSWAILIQDEDGNTIESEYCGDKRWCENSIKNFKEQYNTTKVKKYKAY